MGLLALALTSCSALSYYTQAVRGGLQVQWRKQPVEKLLADPGLDPALAERLRLARQLRRFAVSELSLPDDGSYRAYADLDRPYAVWTVVAAPELSVEPLTWCFPVAGCVSYRGYFSPRRAQRFARRLAGRGYDVEVGGVVAYSTLGWLADPLLNTFIGLPEPELAGLLFHELAHRVAYAADDTPFNESFVTAVELEGVRRWLAAAGREEEMVAYRQREAQDEAVIELLLGYRQRLAEAYQAPESDEQKRRAKAELLAELTADYRTLTAPWGGSPYDAWVDAGLNNAHLASIGAYHELLSAFEALLAELDGDLPRFYQEVATLARLPRQERRSALEGSLAGSHAPRAPTGSREEEGLP